MNQDMIKGKWTEIKGSLRQKWGKLTDSDYDQIAGDQQKLVGRLQKLYGYNKEQAEREVNETLKKL
jgi:uncharacterized protein YjbJ (UPF0337 family)